MHSIEQQRTITRNQEEFEWLFDNMQHSSPQLIVIPFFPFSSLISQLHTLLIKQENNLQHSLFQQRNVMRALQLLSAVCITVTAIPYQYSPFYLFLNDKFSLYRNAFSLPYEERKRGIFQRVSISISSLLFNKNQPQHKELIKIKLPVQQIMEEGNRFMLKLNISVERMSGMEKELKDEIMRNKLFELKELQLKLNRCLSQCKIILNEVDKVIARNRQHFNQSQMKVYIEFVEREGRELKSEMDFIMVSVMKVGIQECLAPMYSLKQ